MAQYPPPEPGQPQSPQPAYTPPPQTAPAGYAPPAQPAAAPKKKGCWIAAAIGCGIVLLLVCGCVAASALGLISLGRPKDLGVTFGEAEYWSAVEKAGTDWPEPPADGEDWGSTDVVYSGSTPLDAEFSSAEVSALLSYSHMGGWPISDMQVRFGDDGAVEMSGLVTYDGAAYPVYVDANADVSGRTISGDINSATVFGIELPAEYYDAAEQYGLSLLNSRLARVEGLDISSAEIVDGQLRLTGTVPAQAERITQP